MATIKQITGTLHEIGESLITNKEHKYSYIQVDESMISKVVIYSGLNGKLRNSVGEKVTLHMQKKTIYAITDQNGQTFYTQAGTFSLLIIWSLLFVISIPLSFLLIGIPLLLMSVWGLVTVVQARKAIERVSMLPNAVAIQVV